MRLAYADPPYPRMAKKWYGDHPDYGGEVDHAALIERLDEGYDGWALSTGAYALLEVLEICPPVRVGIWHCTNTAHPGNMGSWWWSWEAVIVKAARPPDVTTRDLLIAPSPRGFLGGEIAGQKPPVFTRWVLSLMGARVGDEVEDVFAGSGSVAREIARWQTQLELPVYEQTNIMQALGGTA